MTRWVRGTPQVRAIATVFATLFVVFSVWPLAAYPLLRLDAASYQAAIGDKAKQCAGDPIPARGGCWSAAPARVTIAGVDADSGATFAVVAVNGQPATRADLVDPPPPGTIAVGDTLTVRYWHGDVAMLVLDAPSKGAVFTLLATRANPVYREGQFPTGSALTFLLGVAGLLVWGRPLLDDVRGYRERKRRDAAAEADAREATSSPTFGRGLARYGIDLKGAGPR